MSKRFILFLVSFLAVPCLVTALYWSTQQSVISYYAGHRLFLSQNYSEAIPFYEKSLSIDPQNSLASQELAYAYQFTKRYDEAIALFKDLIYSERGSLSMKKSLARTLAWQKDYEQAIRYFQEILDDEKSDETLKEMAEVYLWDKQYLKAQKILEVLDEKKPNDMRTMLLLARTLQYSEQPVKAIPVYEEVLKRQEENTDVRMGLGESQMAAGNFKEAEKQFEKVLEQKPEDLKTREQIADVVSWQKDYKRAIAEYQNVLEKDPGNEKALRKLGDVYQWNKNYDEAAKIYRQLLAQYPDDPIIYLSLAEGETARDHFDEAIIILDEGLKRADTFELRLAYAKNLLYRGDTQKGLDALEELKKKYPRDTQTQTARADALAYLQRFDEAEEAYRELLKVNPDEAELRVKLANVLSWNKKYDEALEIYSELIRQENKSEYRIQKARILGWAHRYHEALKEYDGLLAESQSEAVQFERNAKNSYWSNRILSAAEEYAALLKQEPKNPEALFDLSQLYSRRQVWEKALQTYDKLLGFFPSHFRGREGFEKAKLQAFAPMVRAGYEFFEAKSVGRQTDIRRHTSFLRAEMPLGKKWRLGVEERLGRRSFRDAKAIVESETQADFSFKNSLRWSAGGFFKLVEATPKIGPLYLFGVSFTARIADTVTSMTSYERKRIDSSFTVLSKRLHADEWKERLEWDIHRRVVAGADYSIARYSDNNVHNHAGADILYFISESPKQLTLKYRMDWEAFRESSLDYFAPHAFWHGSIALNWKHYLGAGEVFYGMKEVYYAVGYEAGMDSFGIATHKFSGGVGYDLSRRATVQIQAQYSNSSASVYEDKSVVASAKVYF